MISFIIPVYNEEKRLNRGIDILIECLRNSGITDYEIIISDNASSDNTPVLCKQYTEDFNFIRYARTERKGVGAAIKNAILISNGDYICTMDADMSGSPEIIINTLEYNIHSEYDILNFSRYISGAVSRGRRQHRYIISRFLNLMVSGIFVKRITDIMSGFQIVKNDGLKKQVQSDVITDKWFFSGELLILAQARGLNVLELPIIWSENSDSKVNILSTVKEYLIEIIMLKIRIVFGIM